MSWIDILIGVYLLYSMASGWKRGLAACFFGIVAGLTSIVGAVVLCRPAVALLDQYTGAVTAVSAHIQRSLGASLPSAARITGIMEAMRFPRLLGVEPDLAAGLKPATDLLARSVVGAACFFMLLILLRIVLLALSRILAWPFEHGPVAFINRLAGAVFGGILGFANVAIAWMILMPLAALGIVSPGRLQSSVFLKIAADLVARVVPWVVGGSVVGGV